MDKLTSLSQLKVGTKIKIVAKNGNQSYNSVSVKKLIPMRRYDKFSGMWSEPYDYEILINRKRNYYFSFNNLMIGESQWVAEVYVIEGLDGRLKSVKKEWLKNFEENLNEYGMG